MLVKKIIFFVIYIGQYMPRNNPRRIEVLNIKYEHNLYLVGPPTTFKIVSNLAKAFQSNHEAVLILNLVII